MGRLTRVRLRAFGTACGLSLLGTDMVSRSGFWLRTALPSGAIIWACVGRCMRLSLVLVETPKDAPGEGTYEAKHIIVATGARPRVPLGLEPDKKLIWTYFEAMVPEPYWSASL